MSTNTRDKLMGGLQKRDNTILIDPTIRGLGAALQRSHSPVSSAKIYEIPVEKILMNPFQYRGEESLDTEELESLAKSIATYGLRSPLQLRRKGEELLLVAGWRRLTAIKRYVKSMTTVKATIDETMDDKTHRALTIIENEQRKDFDIFERARAYRDLVEQDAYTHEQVAQMVGANRTRITKTLRVLGLPADLIEKMSAVARQGLSEGHIEELVSGFYRRQETAGEGSAEPAAWVQECLSRFATDSLTIEDLRNANRELASAAKKAGEKPKKEVRRWIIPGDQWRRFEVSTRKNVILEFKLPDNIEHNETEKIIRYLRTEVLRNATSAGKSSS